MNQYNLQVFQAVGAGWNNAKTSNGLILALIFLAYSIITGCASYCNYNIVDPQALQNAISSNNPQEVIAVFQTIVSPVHSYVGILVSLTGTLFAVIMTRAGLTLAKGEQREFSSRLFHMPAEGFWKAVIVDIVVKFLVGISLLCCIVPVFFVAPRLKMAVCYQVENPEADIFESIQASWRMTSGNILNIIGMSITTTFINFIGLLFCCVGINFTQVIGLFTEVDAYHQLKNNLTPDEIA